MTVFETVGPGSIPGRVTRLFDEPSMFSECAGFARDFAKVVDRVRFLARALKKSEVRSVKSGAGLLDDRRENRN